MWPTPSLSASVPPKLPYPISGGAPEEGEEPPAEGETQAPPPQYVSADEFRQFQATQSESLKAMTEAITAMREMAGRPPQVIREEPTAPREPAVTREEYVEAIQTGDIKKVERYEAQQEARFANRIGQMERVGTDAIAELNKRTEVGTLPYYTKYKKEIDGIVEGLPPNMRMAAGVYKYAHDKVVGEHVAEIVAEEREAALRKPKDEDVERAPTGRSGRAVGQETGKVPSVYDLGGQEAEDALAFRGLDADGQARKMGYKSWPDYMEKTKEYR